MNSDIWLVNKIKNSTVSSTRVYPNYIPESTSNNYSDHIPCIVYQSIGFDRNRKNRQIIYSLTSIHNSKSNVEDLNDQLYNLFDNSTQYIRESSSNLHTINVEIINNVPSLYDDDNKYWTRPLDISVWYYVN